MAPDLEQLTYAGHDAVRLRAGALDVYVALGFGPRIVGLELDDSGNLLAELPGATLTIPGGGEYRMRGGHRLWLAPEVPAVTYRPDDEPVSIEPLGGGLRIVGPAEPLTGVRKIVAVAPSGGAGLELRHEVRNEGLAPMRLAPWAITQLPTGGRAWLPLGPAATDEASPIADRALVLWPYTDLADERLRIVNDAVTVTASGGAPPSDPPGRRLKVGTASERGTIAYLRAGWLFEKRVAVDPQARHADLGAALQVYCDDRFIELETLGPLVDLRPGESVEHVETWRVDRTAERQSADELEAA